MVGVRKGLKATVVVVVVFNFEINCHVQIKYSGQKHKHANESILGLRDSLMFTTIGFIYDRINSYPYQRSF